MQVMNHLVAFNPELFMFIVIYLDNVIILDYITEEHLDHVQIALDPLQNASLKLKQSKCKWSQDESELYGFKINQEAAHTLQPEMKVVTEWPLPQNMKGVHGFLSVMSCNHQLIRSCLQIAFLFYLIFKIHKKVGMGGHCGESSIKNMGTWHFVQNGRQRRPSKH